jgi:hypothetical protein
MRRRPGGGDERRSGVQDKSKFGKIQQSRAKPGQRKSKEKAWISLDSLGNYNFDVGHPMCECVSAESKDAAGAPAEEIEVTPGMIKAGIEAYCLWDRDDPTEWKVVDIFMEMERARHEARADPMIASALRLSGEKRQIASMRLNDRT